MTFIDILKEYFRFTENAEPEGWFSWQHILYVSLHLALAVFLGIWLGKKNKNKTPEEKTKVLKVAAIVMLSAELFKIVLNCIRAKDFFYFRTVLPLFLCSVVLFSLPLAAFGKGKWQRAGLDFTFCFGMLCAFAGTFLAGNIFSGSPIFSFDPMVSVFTHCISGFSCIYIGVSGLADIKKENAWMTASVLGGVMTLALIVDILQKPTDYESNYMFLLSSRGTPFSIIEDMVGGSQVLYTIVIMLLHFLYLVLFWGGVQLYRHFKKKHTEKE